MLYIKNGENFLPKNLKTYLLFLLDISTMLYYLVCVFMVKVIMIKLPRERGLA